MIYMKCADCAQYRLRGPCSTCVPNKLVLLYRAGEYLLSSTLVDPVAGPPKVARTMEARWPEVQEAIRHIVLYGVPGDS